MLSITIALLALLFPFQPSSWAWSSGAHKRTSGAATEHTSSPARVSASPVPGAECARLRGHWVGRSKLPQIFTINADCSGFYNLCGVSAKLETSGVDFSATRGHVKLKVLHSEDPQPACPKAGTEYDCSITLESKDVMKTACGSFPSGTYDRAQE